MISIHPHWPSLCQNLRARLSGDDELGRVCFFDELDIFFFFFSWETCWSSRGLGNWLALSDVVVVQYIEIITGLFFFFVDDISMASSSLLDIDDELRWASSFKLNREEEEQIRLAPVLCTETRSYHASYFHSSTFVQRTGTASDWITCWYGHRFISIIRERRNIWMRNKEKARNEVKVVLYFCMLLLSLSLSVSVPRSLTVSLDGEEFSSVYSAETCL